MKKYLKIKEVLCIVFCSIIMLSGIPITAMADNDEYTDIFVSSSEIELLGADAVQAALNTARDNATQDNPYRITVEPGNYPLEKSLLLYSNTYLYLEGVYFKQSGTSRHNLIRTGDYVSDAASGPEGYEAYVNITVDGGTQGGVLDADNTLQNTPVKAGHATNFTLKNMTVMNVRNAHLIEFAGIDGLTVENCTLKNQVLDVEACTEVSTYESIQLDILEFGHFKNYRAEDLTIKNAVFNNCTFQDCPRGIGSHSAVLNNPFDNIIITNCKFDNMKSCAIQSLNWINSEISNNTITNSPRGIAVYSVIKKGKCTHLASEMAAQGSTTNHINCDEYVEPTQSHNIVIKNNKILCGNITDPYISTYTKAGITVSGHMVENGEIPDGNYYVNGAEITNNNITCAGTGIKIADSRNINIENNTIKYKKSDDASDYYGVHLTEDCKNVNVVSNDVQSSKTNAVFVNNSNAGKIENNTLSTENKNGIYLFASSADSISNNIVSKAPDSAVRLYSNSSVCNINSNTVNIANKYGIIATGQSSVTSINNNKMSKQTESAIEIMDAKVGTINSNVISEIPKNAIYVHKNKYTTSAKRIDNNNITLKNGSSDSVGIKLYKQVSSDSISANTVLNGAYGIRISEKSTVKSVSGNNLKNNTVNPLYVAGNCSVKLASNNIFASPVLSYLSNTDKGISINWNKISGAKQYIVYRKKGSEKWAKIGTATGLSYTDKTAKAGTTYSYTVRSMDSDGNLSNMSGKYLSAKRLVKTTVSAVNSKNGVTLKWKKVSGAAGYYVYLVSGSGSYTQIAKISNASTLSYTYKKSKNASKYTFAVCAFSGNSKSTKARATMVFVASPSIKSVKNNAKKQAVVKWNKNTSASGYQIKYVTGSTVKTVTVSSKSSVSKTIKNLKKGKTYKFYIRSYKTVSGKKYYSSYSSAKSVKINR